jgi:hypothetical protein
MGKVELKSLYLPPIEHITEDEFAKRVEPTDVLLATGSVRVLSATLRWGQRLMLQRFGYDGITAKALARYVHAMVVTDPARMQAVDAFPPAVRYTDVAAHWGGIELMHLQLVPPPTTEDIDAVQYAKHDWLGIKYDLKQYLVYPYYMAWGWVPLGWKRFWDDPGKPVCSGLCIRLHQAAGRFTGITDYALYPPARMPTLSGYRVAARFTVPKRMGTAAIDKPWWLA